MPMNLSVGLSRKVGQPKYGSLGASCAVELNVDRDGHRLDADSAEFRERARAAFAARSWAVVDELARHREPFVPPSAGQDHRDDEPDVDDGPTEVAPLPPRRPATAAQVRALGRIAHRRSLHLQGLVAGRFGVDGPEELSIIEASRLIDELRAPANATA